MKIKVESTSSGYHEDEVNQLIYISALNGAWHIVSATLWLFFQKFAYIQKDGATESGSKLYCCSFILLFV